MFKCPGKVQRVVVAHSGADASYGKLRQFQKLGSFRHAVIQEKFLSGYSKSFFENLSEIAAV